MAGVSLLLVERSSVEPWTHVDSRNPETKNGGSFFCHGQHGRRGHWSGQPLICLAIFASSSSFGGTTTVNKYVYVTDYDDYESFTVNPPSGQTGYWSKVVIDGYSADVDIDGPGSQSYSEYFDDYDTRTINFSSNSGGVITGDVWFNWYYYYDGDISMTFYFESGGGPPAGTPPSIDLSMANPGTSYYEFDDVPFQTDVTDPDNDVSKVEFYLDGVLRATDTSAPYNFTYGNAAVSPDHQVHAIAYDSTGNTTSNTVSFAVTNAGGNSSSFDRYVDDINGDGIMEEVAEIWGDAINTFDYNPAIQGYFIPENPQSDSYMSMGTSYDEYCYSVPYPIWFTAFNPYELFDNLFQFSGWFDFGYYSGSYENCDVYMRHIFASVYMSENPVPAGRSYEIQTLETNNAPWITRGGYTSGGGVLNAVFGQWGDVLEVPIMTRIVMYGLPSAPIGSPTSTTVLDTGGNEILQEVSAAIKSITGGVVEIELNFPSPSSIPGAISGGGVSAIAYPKGAVATVANIKILGVKIGVTAAGKFALIIPSSVIGGAGNYDYAIVYSESPPIYFVTPGGSPVVLPVNDGDGKNEFVFDDSSDGKFTMNLKVEVPSDTLAESMEEDGAVFEVEAINGSTITWGPGNPNGKAVANGQFLTATVEYKNLPAEYDQFGTKFTVLKVGSELKAFQAYEVFYTATASNYPGAGQNSPQNWFYYYKQNAGGGSYNYDDSSVSYTAPTGGGEGAIKIANDAYSVGYYFTTKMVGGRLRIDAQFGPFEYYKAFLITVAHEREHAENHVPTSHVDDSDNDKLTTSYEIFDVRTDPNVTESMKIGSPVAGDTWIDGEAYATGPPAESASTNADTSNDWAYPGTNSKQPPPF